MNNWSTTGNDPSNWTLASFQASLQPYQSDLLLLNGVDYKFLRDGPHSETTGHACYPGMFDRRHCTSQRAAAPPMTLPAGHPSISTSAASSRPGGYTGLVSLNQARSSRAPRAFRGPRPAKRSSRISTRGTSSRRTSKGRSRDRRRRGP